MWIPMTTGRSISRVTLVTTHETCSSCLYSGAVNTRLEGITLANSAFHAVKMPAGYKEGRPTVTRWLKIFTWRANGDGINPFANGLIEDCFIRTQDDSTYVNGAGIRRVVYWQDANGSTFVLSPLGSEVRVLQF